MKINIYFLLIVFIALAFLALIFSTHFLSPQIDHSGALNSTIIICGENATVYKIPIQTVPTIINGITASTSIIIGFIGVVIGLIFRETFRNDKKSKSLLCMVILFIAIPLSYLSVVYTLLVSGFPDWALIWSLIGLYLSLFLFIFIILLTIYKWSLDNKGQGKPEENVIRTSKTKICILGGLLSIEQEDRNNHD